MPTPQLTISQTLRQGRIIFSVRHLQQRSHRTTRRRIPRLVVHTSRHHHQHRGLQTRHNLTSLPQTRIISNHLMRPSRHPRQTTSRIRLILSSRIQQTRTTRHLRLHNQIQLLHSITTTTVITQPRRPITLTLLASIPRRYPRLNSPHRRHRLISNNSRRHQEAIVSLLISRHRQRTKVHITTQLHLTRFTLQRLITTMSNNTPNHFISLSITPELGLNTTPKTTHRLHKQHSTNTIPILITSNFSNLI